MRTICTIFIICLFSLSSAYSQMVLSLHPLFTEQDAVLIPEIEGHWELPDFELTISFKKAGDNFYHLKYQAGSSVPEFEAVVVKIKDELFLDLNGIMPDSLGDEDFRDSFLSCHSIYKIGIINDTLILSYLDYSWFFDYAAGKKLQLDYEWINNGMLLTFTTDELRSFFAEHMNEDGIFQDPDILIIERDHLFAETDTAPENYKTGSSFLFSQKCFSEFPLKDGWLGGDGDVSVPMNDTTILFIFSDTYIGDKNQESRQGTGMRMVSNTVAIQTCLPDGETNVQYYWKNMYSDDPEPIFKSFTNRYRFWVVDAFKINNNLYVILQKVGPKPGAAPDDIFNFSLLGFTLAKISNPHEAPYEWNIELSPLPDFTNPLMELRCHAMQGEYIYFLVCRNDTSQFLVRKQIDSIDDPEKPFEYYSSNGRWKEGIEEDDMAGIVNGFRCNTINYHPEIKQWVMISDIWFRDNKIKMHTAPALTGPWTDEIVIYEIPEVTPGNSLYSKSNFCYLAREHAQYYDAKNHVMLLTYDINSTNYSEILSSPNIYTPKIITIPLKKTDLKGSEAAEPQQLQHDE